jgi:tRNA(Ile)-lysidine synthase TilS/MesJ
MNDRMRYIDNRPPRKLINRDLCHITRENDEYYCVTHNARWDVSDGDKCPCSTR